MEEEKEQNKEADKELIIDESEDSLLVEEKIKKLRDNLKLCLKEKTEYLAGWQRAKADFINARKEEEKFREEFVNFASREVIRELLAVADSFETAFRDLEWTKISPKWQEGIKQIYKQITQIFERYNVKTIDAKGLEFNPLEHESVEEVNVDDPKLDKIVIEEVQKGYKIHGQILRPAKVKVGIYKSK